MSTKDDLTTRENEVLALAWQCFEQEPKVDMNKLASLTGYTPGSAAFTMGKIKRKLKNKTAGITTNSPAAKSRQGRPRTSTATSTPVKKRGAGAAGAAGATPTKRARKGTRQPTSSPSADGLAADNDDGDDDDDDDDEDFGDLDGNKVKVKKEEPGFEQGSGFYDESLEGGDVAGGGGGGGGASYGFLDGIETFGVGGGRSAATGYRKLFVENAE